MNRLALLCIATLITIPGFGVAQEPRKVRSNLRTSNSAVVPARSTGVPRPAKPVGRMTSSYQDDGAIVDMAPHAEPIVADPYIQDEGQVVYEDDHFDHSEHVGCESCGDQGCSSCGYGCGIYGNDLCNPLGFDGSRLCICLPSHGWVSVEYLGWTARGMNTPPLVTTSLAGTAQVNAGVLPNATVLFGGNNQILDDNMNGTRVRFGLWSANRPNGGVEGELFGFGTQTQTFDQTSSGNPILARPFYNVVTGQQNSELVAFPNVLSGRVRVDATSKLDGAAVRFRRLLCCNSRTGLSWFRCDAVPVQTRLDCTFGWRYLQLRETLGITEDLTSLDNNNPGTFLISDNFRTLNQFNGGELGVNWQGRRGYWSLDLLMRMGIGNTRQFVNIDGTTSIPRTAAGTSGGLLAQPGRNIGTYDRNQFGMVPELGANLGYQLTQRMRLIAGYTFIYWSNVVRPGDQIDTTVNPNLLAPAINGNNFLGPTFTVRETDYWVQGLSVGADYRW